MSLPRHAAKRDAVEGLIVAALEARGFSVDRISAAGLPDLLVAKHGAQWLVEIKSKTGTLTPPQVQWRARFQGPPPRTLRTVEDALRFPDLEAA